jgi:lactoylglutathione lyase
MIEISNLEHIGIRISDRAKTVSFYELLGFEMIADGGFDKGHPLVMLHPSVASLIAEHVHEANS